MLKQIDRINKRCFWKTRYKYI